ncbi:MAG TPA: response regulator, partial [Terriglobales bacterium]
MFNSNTIRIFMETVNKPGRIPIVEDDPKDVKLTLTALEEFNLANEINVHQRAASRKREKANMSSHLRILFLEDDPNDVALTQAMLEAENILCELKRAETEAEFVAALEQGDIDLILADHTLPSFDGASALQLAMQKRPDVPFIFVSGTLGE